LKAHKKTKKGSELGNRLHEQTADVIRDGRLYRQTKLSPVSKKKWLKETDQCGHTRGLKSCGWFVGWGVWWGWGGGGLGYWGCGWCFGVCCHWVCWVFWAGGVWVFCGVLVWGVLCLRFGWLGGGLVGCVGGCFFGWGVGVFFVVGVWTGNR